MYSENVRFFVSFSSKINTHLVSVFVLPEYQCRGICRKMIETLEVDEYFQRAWRTSEVHNRYVTCKVPKITILSMLH